MSDPIHEARILIVDDEVSNVRLLERILIRAGYSNVRGTTSSRNVVPICTAWWPDLIMLDLKMPHMDGFDVIRALHELVQPGSYLPILVLTADPEFSTKLNALASGAKDYLSKPFDHAEVLLRVRNLLETWLLHRQVREQNQTLELRVRERTADLEEAHLEVLERLARASEYRDDATGQHARRVGGLAARVTAAMGYADQVESVRRAGPLHDIGKIAIPDSILLKPGKLTREEFNLMKTHTTAGAGLLAGGKNDLIRIAEGIALTHHERWDGQGYPRGLQGEEIPIPGRVVAIADVFDALTHPRPYKMAWPLPEALQEIRRQGGAQFDPMVVDAFFTLSASEMQDLSLEEEEPLVGAAD